MLVHSCRQYLTWTLLLLLLLCVYCEGRAAAQVIFYVSPNGNDDSLGSESLPFKTLEKSRIAVRSINTQMTSDIVVYLRGGEYVLPTPLVFDQEDSGTNGFSVVYMAYPGEKPVLNGGQRIAGWTEVGDGIYKAPVGNLRFRQLYVNGIRAIRARTPNSGRYYQLRSWDTAKKRIEINSSEINKWQGLNQVEMVVLGKGVNQANLRVGSFSVADNSGYLNGFLVDPAVGDNSLYRRAIRKLVKKLVASAFVIPMEPERTRIFEQEYPPKESRPYYFENAYEFLDEPGEWYLNTVTNEVFYRPRAGEDMVTAAVVAPRLEQLLRVQGTISSPAHHIQFHGLTFEYSTWILPNSDGFIGDQAFVIFTQSLPADEITSYPGHRHPAAVHVEAANNIRFERNVFHHLGSSGLNLYMGTQDVTVIGNRFMDISAGGIAVDLNLEGNPSNTGKVTRRPVISNNYVTGIGKDYCQNVGIAASYVDSAIIEHNELADLPYSGISVGWGWDDKDNTARNNLVRYNKIWNVLTLLSDGGGIYTLSRQPGTLIAENYVHNITRTPVHGDFNISGIYLDEGSNVLTVRDNVLVNTGDRQIFQHANGPSNTFSNNNVASSTVIANAGLERAYWNIRPSVPPL